MNHGTAAYSLFHPVISLEQKWQTEALSGESVDCLRACTLSFTPSEVMPPLSFMPWGEGSFTMTRCRNLPTTGNAVFKPCSKALHGPVRFKSHTLYFMCAKKLKTVLLEALLVFVIDAKSRLYRHRPGFDEMFVF